MRVERALEYKKGRQQAENKQKVKESQLSNTYGGMKRLNTEGEGAGGSKSWGGGEEMEKESEMGNVQELGGLLMFVPI